MGRRRGQPSLSATLARTLELNRESIERRDFPIARRGYDPAAVAAHLQALAATVQELSRRAAASAEEPSLGSAAATRVQGILEAAQVTAAEIGREAQRDAQRTREDVAQEVERARAHVETLAHAASGLLAQVESLDREVSALARSLRERGEESQGGAMALVRDEFPADEMTLVGGEGSVSEQGGSASAPAIPSTAEGSQGLGSSFPVLAAEGSEGLTPSVPVTNTQRSADLDGARLVALNMALSGESREQTDRYLADSFQLADRAKLLDEVYAAVEG